MMSNLDVTLLVRQPGQVARRTDEGLLPATEHFRRGVNAQEAITTLALEFGFSRTLARASNGSNENPMLGVVRPLEGLGSLGALVVALRAPGEHSGLQPAGRRLRSLRLIRG